MTPSSSAPSGRRYLQIAAGMAGVVALAAGAAAWFGNGLDPSEPPAQQVSAPAASQPVSSPRTTVKVDPVKVFQKAFWRSPTANDKILHAERREWRDDDGLKRWQWFIALEPSPELVKYLRADNAFGLVATRSLLGVEEAPPWFQVNPDETVILASPRSKLRLIFSTTRNALLATDSGKDLRPGAPEPVKPVKPATRGTASGRLPASPPPKHGP